MFLKKKKNKYTYLTIFEQDQIIANRGYPVETHTIQTTDGYLLDCFRIPYGRQSGPKPNKPVVFLQHGLLSSSADWIIGHTESALGKT